MSSTESGEDDDTLFEGTTDSGRFEEFLEASLLLCMWSILVMNEGVVRFIQHGKPGAPGLFSGKPVRFFAPFLGGLFEVMFGMMGLALGVCGGILRKHYSRAAALAFLVGQNVLGWYVFIDFVFLIPAYRIANETPMLGLSAVSSRAIGVCGILSSMNWCLALQGGQFIFAARMIAHAGSSDFLKQRIGGGYARMRGVFWNVNYIAAGLWATITAVIVIAGKGTGITSPGPYFAPPNVGRIPVYLFITGIIIMTWGVIGIILSLTNNYKAIPIYAVASFFVFIFVHIAYTIGQLGFIAGNPAPSAVPAAGAALHNHLTFMLSFLGPYHMLKQVKEAPR